MRQGARKRRFPCQGVERAVACARRRNHHPLRQVTRDGEEGGEKATGRFLGGLSRTEDRAPDFGYN